MTEARTPDRTGTAAGVPYIAFAPQQPQPDSPLVYVLHLMDPPRSERAMAAALPLDGLDAWKIYAGLPMNGERIPAGGFEEIQRLANEDGLMLLLAPVIEQAAAELPAAVAALREELDVPDGPLALVGGSAGGAAVLLMLVEGEVDVKAAALANPATRTGAVVEAMERMFGFQYDWTDERRATADKLDFVRRAPDLVEAGEVPLSIVAGEEDALAELPVASRALIEALSNLYSEPERASFISIPGLGHGLADEPGFEPSPQNDHAKQVDAAIVEWLKRWLPA
jgi:pimeloyl-ACP methyl ester carboxylesterase